MKVKYRNEKISAARQRYPTPQTLVNTGKVRNYAIEISENVAF